MTDHARAARLAERIHVLVAKILERGIKDPRLGFVTVTDVRVTGDLQNATVFYTVYGSDEERDDSAAALKSATGRIRSEVGKNLGIRLTPTLEFVHDGLPENAQQIDSLLAKAREADAKLAAERSGKTYAGDADPYRDEETELEN
ncbi:30S ribosome-binding factor RbfA [Gulosibacter bifidus]|uniref:Ribosome-binding factor A n=1 Tax=Gulosibacter bifidus TaxID=272239 RepID=A0ABW5RGU3_9MICO|nr:30S ribosome-binding factor RbfA [Gulosibacter bifidus]